MKRQRRTRRGFNIIKFTDASDNVCSLQESSCGMEDRIWLGVDDADPKVLASESEIVGVKTEKTCGWVA